MSASDRWVRLPTLSRQARALAPCREGMVDQAGSPRPCSRHAAPDDHEHAGHYAHLDRQPQAVNTRPEHRAESPQAKRGPQMPLHTPGRPLSSPRAPSVPACPCARCTLLALAHINILPLTRPQGGISVYVRGQDQHVCPGSGSTCCPSLRVPSGASASAVPVWVLGVGELMPVVDCQRDAG